jgi:hypothetical protein
MAHSMRKRNPGRPARKHARAIATGALVLASSLAGVGTACAQPPKSPYPSIAPIEQYRMASQAEEAALARSAAPASISNDADVLVLGARGYETAAKGKNGFVCIVERSWANDFGDAEFWNPKVRGPICFNAASARSVLPTYLKRTEWVLANMSTAEMIDRTKAALAAHVIVPPEVGSMCFMMAKGGYLGDGAGGHWHPHVMFFLPRTDGSAWGANLPGSPVIVPDSSNAIEPFTIFMSLVPKWSDGTPASAM